MIISSQNNLLNTIFNIIFAGVITDANRHLESRSALGLNYPTSGAGTKLPVGWDR